MRLTAPLRWLARRFAPKRATLDNIARLSDAVEDADSRRLTVLHQRAAWAWRTLLAFLFVEFVFLAAVFFSQGANVTPFHGGGTKGDITLWAGILAALWPLVYFFVIRTSFQRYFQWQMDRTQRSTAELRSELMKHIVDFELANDYARMRDIVERGRRLATVVPVRTEQQQRKERLASQQQQMKRSKIAATPAQPGSARPVAAVRGAGSAAARPGSAPMAFRGADPASLQHSSPAVRPSTPLSAEEARAAERVAAQQQHQQPAYVPSGGNDLWRRAVAGAAASNLPPRAYTMPVPQDVLRAASTSFDTDDEHAHAAAAPRSPFAWLLDAVVGEPPKVPVTCTHCSRVHGHAPGDGRHLLAFTCRHCGAFNPRRTGQPEPRANSLSNANEHIADDVNRQVAGDGNNNNSNNNNNLAYGNDNDNDANGAANDQAHDAEQESDSDIDDGGDASATNVPVRPAAKRTSSPKRRQSPRSKGAAAKKDE